MISTEFTAHSLRLQVTGVAKLYFFWLLATSFDALASISLTCVEHHYYLFALKVGGRLE